MNYAKHVTHLHVQANLREGVMRQLKARRRCRSDLRIHLVVQRMLLVLHV